MVEGGFRIEGVCWLTGRGGKGSPPETLWMFIHLGLNA